MVSLQPYSHGHYEIPQHTIVDPAKWLKKTYQKPFCYITPSGRDAIYALMQNLDLKIKDEVFISTTFSYPNVSSCVTSTIFNFCKPSRELTSSTRAIFIIHEFGVPHPETLKLRKIANEMSIPLIEDLAHTLNSSRNGIRVGENADYIICSFPKIFPVPYGGALMGKKIEYSPSELVKSKIDVVTKSIGHFLPVLEEYSNSRRVVFKKLKNEFSKYDLSPVYEIDDLITPWFFPVAMKNWEKCLVEAPNHGIECGLWHGTNIVVFPCHQFLDDQDICKIANFVSLFK